MNIEQEFIDLKQVVAEAGKLAREYFDSPINPNTQKNDGSVVTEIDKKAEAMLRAHIEERFPEDTIVGEEDDTKEGTSGFVWFIDPIDGTDNFVRKIPFFAVTVTRLGPSPEDSFAIVHNPVSGQTFSSLMEDGSYENEHICTVTTDTIGGKLFIPVTGASKHFDWVASARTNLWKAIYLKYGKSGAFHSALLEFAYVAAGRLDGYLVLGLDPWDSAAGLYLVRAAGGAISVCIDGTWRRYDGAIKDLYGENFDIRPMLFVSHPDIHDEVLEFVGDPQTWADE